MNQQEELPVTIVRGGTSKAVFVRADHMPQLPDADRDQLLRAIFGSPDRRQIDGLGGADLLTSKFSIIGPSSRPDADVDYTFAQIGIEMSTVAWDLNCGNISAAVGPYALEEGIAAPQSPDAATAAVRIHNTNTGRLIVADVPLADGRPAIDGDFAIDGVPGTGARIDLNFADSAGGTTGRLLPTGNRSDTLAVDGDGEIEVSIVDAGNPVIFVAAQSLGLDGTEDPAVLESDLDWIERVDRIRSHGAVLAGMASSVDRAPVECPTAPFVSVVSWPRPWADFQTGAMRAADSSDLVARLYLMRRMHRAYAGTGTVCTGVASRIPGTIPSRYLSEQARASGTVRIGHPSGVIPIDVEVEDRPDESGGPVVHRAAIARTARRLLDGKVYVRTSQLSEMTRSALG